MTTVSTEDTLAGVGGPRLYRRTWRPERDPRAVVVLAHGAGEHCGRYEDVAVSRDPDVVAAYVGDPLVHHGKLPVRTVSELAKAARSFPDGVGAITIPTLLMYGTADGLAPPHGSVMLADRIGSDDLLVKPYEGLYHEIFNEPERDQVLDHTLAWLDAHTPG